MGTNQVSLIDLKKELRKYANLDRAKQSQYFFKTGPGQYGEGDVFIGVSVPDQRIVAKNYYNLSLSDVERLLKSSIHEERLTASIILVAKFKKADDLGKEKIYNFYLANTEYINNWDIIDGSAPYIVGGWLIDKNKDILIQMAKSSSIWKRRIAILSTFAFIYAGDDEWTYKISKILLHDEHDLIQKAVGWMLREAGKRVSLETEEQFLLKHYKIMPRTMLRYAIERFDEPKRKAYLAGTI